MAIKWKEIRTGKRTLVISGNNNRKNKVGLSSVPRGLDHSGITMVSH